MNQKLFTIYAQQTTDYKIEIQADTLEDAMRIAHDSGSDEWREIGELGWNYLDGETEIEELGPKATL